MITRTESQAAEITILRIETGEHDGPAVLDADIVVLVHDAGNTMGRLPQMFSMTFAKPTIGVVTKIDGKTYKIHKSQKLTEKFSGNPGEIVDNNNRLVCMCGDGNCIEILEIQAEGKRKMDSASFLRGHKIEKGTVLGE